MNKIDTKEQILHTLDFRHACKEFDINKKIAKEDFDTILESARLSPSSFGVEPWKIIILQNKNIRDKIKPFCWGAQKQLETASHFLVLLARSGKDMKYNSDYILETMRDLHGSSPEVIRNRSENLKRFQKSDFNLNNDDLLFEWACRQVYITLANMMMSAALLKIDSCPIEGFFKKQVEENLVAEGILDTNHFGIACMAAFGYRAVDPTRKRNRRKIEEITQIVE